MKKLAFLAAAALAFGLWPFAPRLGPVAGSIALVALAVVLAVAAGASASAVAMAAGALGAFASGMLAASPAAAGAALAGLCFAERSLRVKTSSARALHVAVAIVGGALAGSLTTSFALSPAPVRAVAVTVAAVLLALPLLIDADDPVAHALAAAAAEIPGPEAAPLREAAELRRTVDEDLLDAATARHARETWRALLRLSEARGRLARAPARKGAGSPAEAVLRRVDERIAEHVRALERAYTAAGAAQAAEASLDDAALRRVENAGDSLEQVSRALVDEIEAPLKGA
jgi:MFS family permease